MSEWQPIETAPLDVRVLVCDETGCVDAVCMALGEILNGREIAELSRKFGWTHWMPLPEPPKEE